MHETGERHHHVRSAATAKGASSRMACEKASRRLRATLLKAERLGLSAGELAQLSAAKRIVAQRQHDWRMGLLLLLLFMFGGGLIVALFCTRGGASSCSKIEDINLAT
ncbi:uncharacterized protein LOC106642483 [Copidosoma floridanum]|uniref:uncharacterized protein LOC106642483 n=1 Tax=Copidosoma floridanum TaxID=29053 RepID=UPI0006C9469E|nr:uncharacterized protein LOC106642483 [Copidosoma floridanum]